MPYNPVKVLLPILLGAFLFAPTVAAGDLPEAGLPECDAAWTFTYPDPAPTWDPVFLECWGSFEGIDIGAQGYESEIRELLAGYDPGAWSYIGTADDKTLGTGFGSGTTIGDEYGYVEFQPPFTGAFALVMKSAERFSIFYFASAFHAGVYYHTAGVSINPPGTCPQELSHVSLWQKDVTTVPEPSSMLLLASGLLGLGVVGYRRRRK
jgi:hypothetical protein